MVISQQVQRTHVLVIEDDDADAELIQAVLEDTEGGAFSVDRVRTLGEARGALNRIEPDVVLADLDLPDASGLATVIGARDAAPDLPIIVLTGLIRHTLVTDALRAGAQDCLSKDAIEPELLRRTIRHAIERHRLLVELRRVTEAQQYLATHDDLTGLPKRQLLLDRIEQGVTRAQRWDRHLAVLFVDLDGFKPINDRLGHDVGDEVLKIVAKRLRRTVRRSDTVSRFGGDEFIVLLAEVASERDAGLAADQLIRVVEAPIRIGDHDVNVGASVGIATFPANGSDADELLKAADTAMYRAKEAGGSTYAFFAPELEQEAQARRILTQELRDALAAEQFRVAYQPLLDLQRGEIVAVEALLRWEHPERGTLLPGAFLDEAEASGLIIPIGSSALQIACTELVRWHAAGLHPARMCVNLSRRQLGSPEIAERLLRMVRECGAAPEWIELELTDHDLGSLLTDPRMVVDRLADAGFRLSVAGLPTSVQALLRLRDRAIGTLKLERALVQALETGSLDRGIAEGLIEMAHGLGLKVVAQGVETAAQFSMLREIGSDMIQGYLLSRPVDAAGIPALLSTPVDTELLARGD